MNIFKKIELNDNTKKINKTDWIIMGIMVLVYGVLSFIRLGDTKVPSTYKTFDQDEEVVITLGELSYVDVMNYYAGNELGSIKLLSSIDGYEYEDVTTIDIGSVFTWNEVGIHKNAKYIKFVGESSGVTLGDVVFYDTNSSEISAIIDDNNKALTDETDLIPDEKSFMNNTYFDEIYYARSAYEYAHGINAYEWSHPPLGKLIMTIPVLLFGFSPFTYRLMGNIFGVLLIPAMYILGKKIFKNRKWALLAGLLMMFDTFHFAHTRIALVDGFQVFFIILSVLFMKNYMDLGKDDDFKKKAKNLFFSGLFIGCAIDTKWNAVYVGLGLAIAFFVHLFGQYGINIFKLCKKHITLKRVLIGCTALIVIPYVLYYLSFIIINKNVASIIRTGYYILCAFVLFIIAFKYIIENKILSKFFKTFFKDKYLLKLMVVCIISFIIVPIVIYGLSYLLFPKLSYYDGTLKGIIDINKMMYDYHSNLDATHPFSSSWYEWPMMLKPVWLYMGNTKAGVKMTISDIGNPAIWWFGVVSVIYLVISTIRKKDKNYIFILIFIISTFVPYMFIGRLMFMYHYFITLPFVMFAIVAFIKWITDKIKSDKVYYGYIALIIFTFILFYPIVSAMPVSDNYIDSLKWLSGWFF